MQLFLQTCTTNLKESKSFFESLDFVIEENEDFTLVYDDQLKIMLMHENKARPGLTLIKENWDKELAEISKLTNVISQKDAHYFASPSGTWFKLLTGEKVVTPPTNRKCILGNYAGISLETMDIQKSIDILTCLGFEKSSGAMEQGWISMTDDAQNSISLMAPFACPHSFCNPSATFFNAGKNPNIIANVRSREIPIYEEITVFNTNGEVDNIILREPGGIGFFVFND